MVDLQHLRTVRCANPQDGDFPPPSPHCNGLINLRSKADEGGAHYRCPDCERAVYPEAEQKQRFDSLIVHHRQAGIEALLIDRCSELAVGSAFVGGVLALSVQGMNAAVCLVDYCSDERWHGRGFGINQRCVYVSVGPDVAARILREDAIAHVELVDIVLGGKDLQALLVERATHVPALLSNVDVPVYSLGARLITPQQQEPPGPPRTFHIWLSPDGLLVDGLLAVRATRTTAILIMRVLIRRLTEALASGGPVEPISAEDIADAVQDSTGNVQDVDTIRRHISRMRTDVTDTVRRRTGKPIGEHDIIETVSRSGAGDGAEGYRLNPATVALGRFGA